MKYFTVALFLLLIVGCQHTPVVEERNVYKTILVTPPDELLQDCEIQPPPDATRYQEAEWTDKEHLLIMTIDSATRKAVLCSSQKKSLRDWKQEQKRIYLDKDKPTEN